MKKLLDLFLKYKMTILYVFFGGVTTLINIIVYNVCYYVFGISNDVSNIISWFITVSVAYITNKIWVFESKDMRLKALIFEIVTFFACRLLTGFIDLFIMHIAVDVMNYSAWFFKILSNIIVIVLNYIASKRVIFAKDKSKFSPHEYLADLLSNLKNNVLTVATAVYSLIFSAAVVLTGKINFTGNVEDRLSKNYMNDIAALDIVKFILCAAASFVCAEIIFMVLGRIKRPFGKSGPYRFRTFFIVDFVITLAAWGVCFLTFYPGAGMNDTLWIIKQPVKMSVQHPILYNLFVSGCTDIGRKLFGSPDIGIAINVIIQMIVMALSVSYCTAWFNKKGGPRVISVLIALSYIVLPIFADFSITVIKDTLFSVFIMLCIPVMYDSVTSEGKFLASKSGIFAFSLLSLLLVLVRNNGIYVFAALCVVMFLLLKKNRRRIAIIFVAVLICGMIPNKVLKHMGVEQKFQESVAIPIQQISMVITDYGEISYEDRQFISQILPTKEIAANYSPMSSDNIKWDGNFNGDFLNAHSGEFIGLWARLLKNNPALYIKAYLMETYGFWSVGTYSNNQSSFFTIANSADNPRMKAYIAEEGISNTPIMSTGVFDKVSSFYHNNCRYPGAGTCVWVFLFMILVLIYKKRPREILIFAPCLLVWGTLLISAPVAFAFRYAFSFALSMPFLVFIPLSDTIEGNTNQKI